MVFICVVWLQLLVTLMQHVHTLIRMNFMFLPSEVILTAMVSCHCYWLVLNSSQVY